MEQFQFSEKYCAQAEALIAKLSRTLSALVDDINAEETRTGMCDVCSVAYPTLARQLRARYENLNVTIATLRSRLPESRI